MKYEMPIMEIYVCSREDIIATSGLTLEDEGAGVVVNFSSIKFNPFEA